MEDFPLSTDKVLNLLTEGFRRFGNGRLVNEAMPLEKIEEDGTLHLIIQHKATDLDSNNTIHKRIDEYWEGGKKIKRTATLTLYHNGEVVQTFEGDDITNARTGGAAALMAYHLTPRIDKLAVVGTGEVAKQAIKSAYHLTRPKFIHYGSSSAERAKALEPELQKLAPESKVIGHGIYEGNAFSEGMAEMLRDADALIIANKLRHPILYSMIQTMRANAHISAMSGDADQHNLEQAVLMHAKMVFDIQEKARKTGECRHLTEDEYAHLNIAGTVGDILNGKANGAQLTVYDSTGMGVSDLIIAQAL